MVSLKKKQLTKLYWMGALPKEGTFKYKRSSEKQTAIMNDNSEFCTYEDATTSALWNKWEIWTGKCRYAQNIGVHGHEYVGFSDRPIESKGEAPGAVHLTFDSWPCSVVKLTQEKMEAIVDATFNTFQREENGKDNPRNSPLTIKFLNFKLDHARDHIIDPSGRNPRLSDCRTDQNEFDDSRDTCVSEYVYITELEADPVATKPEDYWTLPRTTMEQFFANPPRPLSETWKKPEARA
jgi:hypothetical protein